MRELKKISTTEVERALMADADDIDAWEAPIHVPPTSGPRPEWYGRKEIAIGMSVEDRGNQVDAQQVYDFIASGATGATVYEFKPTGIAGAAADLYLVLRAVASVASIANVLWTAYDRFIARKKHDTPDSADLHIAIRKRDGTMMNISLGNVSTKESFVERLEVVIAETSEPGLRAAHELKIQELEESDSWVKLNGRDEPRG